MRNSGFILLFEQWSIAKIADELEIAASGAGTDEEKIVSAILQLSSGKSVIQLNQLLSGSDKYGYKTLGDLLAGEFGGFDQEYLDKINSHLKKIGATNLTKEINMPVAPTPSIISEIIPRIKQHEGVKPKVYIDTVGKPTVGIGFNLTREDSVQRINAIGADFNKIKAGKAELTAEQMDQLLIDDLKIAQADAKSLVSNFDQLPRGVQGVLIEMAFNLGKTRLSGFKKFLDYIESKKFTSASSEMLKSLWAKQVGKRANTLADIVKQADKKSA